MIAPKCVTPNMPRLDTVNVPPSISGCLSVPARARSARSRASTATWRSVFVSTPRMTGTISPSSRATAMPMFACAW